MHSFVLATFVFSISAITVPERFERQSYNNPNSICLSFGIDYQDGGNYFINQNSTDAWTAVSQFEGCNVDKADVWFIPSSGDELTCSSIQTTPDNINEVTTCPIKKNQLKSANYTLIVFGNNGIGNPFSFQRDFVLNVGKQITSTVTPTITFRVTATSHSAVTQTSTQTITNTHQPVTTYSVPTATANCTNTVRPHPTATTITRTITWKRNKYAHIASIVYETEVASCTIPRRPEQPDPTMTYIPRRFTPAAMLKKVHKERGAEPRSVRMAKRTPDAPTITVTYSPAISTTMTVDSTTVTDIASSVVTSTAYTTLAPSTTRTGIVTCTTSLPTPVRTHLLFTYITEVSTKTYSFKYTYTTTTTPYAVKTNCARAGGHFGGRWW